MKPNIEQPTAVQHIIPRYSPWRFWLSGWLCRIACWLRREKWYVGEAWHAVPGNRASDLQQEIWIEFVAASHGNPDWKEKCEDLEPKLNELAQAAGVAWGHIWPKNKTP